MVAVDVANGDSAPPANPSTRDVWIAIEQLRNESRRSNDQLRTETSDARHAQTGLVTNAILELRRDVDVRLREIERTIDSSNPISLGPRLNILEQWRAKLDASDEGGAPTRLDNLEDGQQRRKGAEQLLLYVPIALSTLAALAAIYANLKP